MALLLRAVAGLTADAELCAPIWDLARSYEELANKGQRPTRRLVHLQAQQAPDIPAQPRPGGLEVVRRTIVSLVRHEGANLSAAEIGAYLSCYAGPAVPSPTSLADELWVSMPVLHRALERLAEFDLVRLGKSSSGTERQAIRRTPAGTTLLRDLKRVLAGTDKETRRVGCESSQVAQ